MRYLSLLLLVGVVGCSAFLLEPEPAWFSFSSQRLPLGQPTRSEVAAQPGTGELRVLGRIETPTPCQILTARSERNGPLVTLVVEARDEGDGCTDVVAGFTYDAAVHDLAPGVYRLKVLHSYPGTGWPRATVLEHNVSVP